MNKGERVGDGGQGGESGGGGQRGESGRWGTERRLIEGRREREERGYLKGEREGWYISQTSCISSSASFTSCDVSLPTCSVASLLSVNIRTATDTARTNAYVVHQHVN